jgi:molecular chaperone GrpE
MTDKKKKPEIEPEAMNQEVETASAEEIQEAGSSEVETLRAEVEDYKKKYLRAIADYQNFERRMREERKEMRNIIKADIIQMFLPTLDTLHKAELFIKDPGLKMVMDQFYQTFEQAGVKEIEIMGKEFDPHVAEVIDVVPGDEDNIVTEVLRKGYTLNGSVIQHAQVKVSKKKEN